MCNDRIYQIVLDKEFDLINNPNTKEKLNREKTKIIYVSFIDKIEPGLTLINRKQKIKEMCITGVKVINLQKKKKLKEYLKLGDTILYLNGVPCMDARCAIDIIGHYYEKGEILKIELECKKNEKLYSCIDIFRKNRKIDLSN